MSDHKPANPPPPPPAFPKSEEMVDPWASLPPQPSASGGKPVATSMWGPPAAVVTRPVDAKLDEAITPDGHVNMSCFVPVGVGAVTGALGGGLVNIFARQSAPVGCFAGAATMAVVSTVTCNLIKARNGTIYDKSNDRTIAYAAGGAVWPIAGEVARTILRHPVLHPKVALQRSLTGAVAGGLFGFVMDYFELARPDRPSDLAAQAPPKQ